MLLPRTAEASAADEAVTSPAVCILVVVWCVCVVCAFAGTRSSSSSASSSLLFVVVVLGERELRQHGTRVGRAGACACTFVVPGTAAAQQQHGIVLRVLDEQAAQG